jgi:hypothetical protein
MFSLDEVSSRLFCFCPLAREIARTAELRGLFCFQLLAILAIVAILAIMAIPAI